MDQTEKNKSPWELFPSVSAQLRGALSDLWIAASALATREQREQDPELDRRAALLDQSCYRLMRLAGNLTLAARLGSDEPLAVRDEELVALVGEWCAACQGAASLLGLELHMTCSMERCVCAVDRSSLEELFYQLLSNAFKFTPAPGSVTVELKTAGSYIQLCVTDTGCGIPETMLDTLFDRVEHPELLAPPPHALGMGLALCRRIAEGHGGSIMAESREGKGTRVTVSLPSRQLGVGTVSDVSMDLHGGFNRTLLALADALPRQAFLVRYTD